MEPTGLAFVITFVAGMQMVGPDPVPIEQCEALKAKDPATICVYVEPACGKGTGQYCFANDTPPARKKARPVTRRYHRKASFSEQVSSLMSP